MDSRPNYMKQIEQRISNMRPGEACSAKDFSDLANAASVNRALSRLAEEGKLRRVLQGIYDKPVFSPMLGEVGSPEPDQIARAIARKFRWTVAPAEDAALNLLHLCTQVPNTWVYVSDGPYRSFSFDGCEIVFRKRTNREISGMHANTILVIQALRALGKDRVTEAEIQTVRSGFSEEERREIRAEARTAPAWIYGLIQKICTEDRI